ncbi:hypothetical protein QE152_g41586, partial [Popillia japonica]
MRIYRKQRLLFMSAGLFNKLLGQSGVATEPTLISPADTGVTLAEKLGLQTEDL